MSIATVPQKLVRRLLLRGASTWLLARLMGMATLAAVSNPASSLLPAWVLVMTAILTLVDLHRRKEVVLLHNLGIRTSHAVALVTLPAIAAEALLVMLRS